MARSEGLLTLNNEGDYIGLGSRGYTSGLPGDGYTAGSPARLRDLWVLSESQETVGVGTDPVRGVHISVSKSGHVTLRITVLRVLRTGSQPMGGAQTV